MSDVPKLQGIDHVHIYTANRGAAVRWYRDMLGFTPVERLLSWADGGGPLTLENTEKNIHLALFETDAGGGGSTIAFGAAATEFIAWKAHLENKGVNVRVEDHDISYSMYFADPDKNMYEITTFDYEIIANTFAAGE